MKILVDTCVFLDALQKRAPFWEMSYQVLCLVLKGKVDGRITAKSVSDIYYHMRNLVQNKEKAKTQLYALLELFQIEDTLAEDCRNAMIGDYPDFEDGVLIETAKRTKAACIVTRNLKDFEIAGVQVVTPEDFLLLMKKKKLKREFN